MAKVHHPHPAHIDLHEKARIKGCSEARFRGYFGFLWHSKVTCLYGSRTLWPCVSSKATGIVGGARLARDPGCSMTHVICLATHRSESSTVLERLWGSGRGISYEGKSVFRIDLQQVARFSDKECFMARALF